MKTALKKIWYRLFRHSPDEIIDRVVPAGRMLMPFLSAERVAALQRDLHANDRRGLVDRLVKRELERRCLALSEGEQRELNRSALWGGEAGMRWHEKARQRYSDPVSFETEYLVLRSASVAQLRELCGSGRYEELCEIGTGNGMFLEYLSREIQGIERFVGVDLSAQQIAGNRAAYAGSRLQFLHGEATAYARDNRTRPTVFVFAGTLECLTEEELRELLSALHVREAPTAVALIEPVNIDLETELRSRPRGPLLFSHNYPHLLREAGFAIREVDIRPIGESGADAVQVSLSATAG